ncbi:MAG TPA: arsenate reductase ArsC [Saprospiraceae bacterium]|nr:arsenate reductase ArsC [Saprospiraceae bacterium]HMQ84180.1 arsenate reductase ArsC [Saprospiraceae bacterium]
MKKVLVLCVNNSCRSQMAEGYLNYYGSRFALFYSAGSNPTELHELAKQVMEEDSIDIHAYTAKALSSFYGQKFDYLISVCNEVPDELLNRIKFKHKIQLNIPDPAKAKGTDAEKLKEFRRVREMIKVQMLKFIGRELLVEAPIAA